MFHIWEKTTTAILCWFLWALFLLSIPEVFAAVDIPGWSKIKTVSIEMELNEQSNITTNTVKDIGMNFLSIARIIISGFAIIYMVMIGAYMILYSDSESETNKQKQQMVNVLVAFLFLNLPALVYNLFLTKKPSSLDKPWSWNDSNPYNTWFWNSDIMGNFIANIVNILKILAFIAAVIMFTWGAFQMITSRGKDEYKEASQNRIIYGILALIFLGLVEWWGRMVANPDIQQSVTQVAWPLFGLALYFAAPIAVIFLMIWAYYYITSAGDESRTKKGKQIIIYTLAASVILLASFSFLNDLSWFFSHINSPWK